MAREAIIKLGQKITDRIGVKVTEKDPEYWGLAGIITDEEANMLLNMKVRKPMRIDELVKKTGIEKNKLEEMLKDLAIKGMVEYNWENEDHEKQYILPMFVPGSAEFMVMNVSQVEAHPEIADFFEQMTRIPLEKVTCMVPPGGSGVGMHVIPVEKAIDTTQKSASVEHISHWLNKYKDKYAVGQCSCRVQQRVRGEGTGEIEGELCIGVGDMADFIVETKRGRYIELDEVLAILKRSEENGFVHQITNIDGEDKIFAICNCAPGVCNALRTSQLFNTPNMSRSAYRAHVDSDKCTACGECARVCPVGAAKLGQRLETKNGKIEYPISELPDRTKWGKDKWNPNYRDTQKINCYDTGTSPCKTACPSHLSVQGYVKLASMGRYMDAIELIKEDNPFPAICGAICNKRCETECTRGLIDSAVSVDEIKKFLANWELKEENRYIPECLNHEGKEFSQKIAIIGAGPSGLSCAYYLRKRGYKVTVFEKESRAGGMLLNGIPSYRLEKDIIDAEIDVIKKMGVEFKFNTEVGKDVTLADLRKEGFKAFYIAIGLQNGRSVGLENEDAMGIESGVSFLRRIALNDKVKLNGKTLVIGGGNVASDVARSAVRAGSDKVTMICLEQRDQMPAAKDEVLEALEEGIEIINGYGPKEIKVKDGRVSSLVFKKCLSVLDENKRFNPKFNEEDTIEIEVDNLLLSVGQSIELGDLLTKESVEVSPRGTILGDKVTQQTSVDDIFVGGDAYTGARFAIDAIANGKNASESIHRFVNKGQSLTLGRDLREFISLDKNRVVIEEFDNAKRQTPKHTTYDLSSFRDNRELLTEEQVVTEAKRCLGCGLSVVDLNRCIGCGLCTTKCKFDAIHLERDIPEASRMRKAEDKLKGILPYAAKRAIKIKYDSIMGKK